MARSKEEIFAHYKDYILKDNIAKQVRFNVVQYLCSFPTIDPYQMAASIVRDGYQIVYDDSSISQEENAKHARKVANLLRCKND